MTIEKRKFIQFIAVSGVALALAACGGGGDDGTAAGSGGGTGGGATGTLTITGVNNLPVAASGLTPDAGLPGAGQSAASALGSTGLNLVIASLVNNNLRFMSAPLSGTTPVALGSSFNIVVDGGPAQGSVMVLTATPVGSASGYFYSSASGVAKVTALSATSVDLLFTNVTLKATVGATGQLATGQVILNGTVTVKRV